MYIWYLGIGKNSELRALPHTEISQNEYEFVQNLVNSKKERRKKQKKNEENEKIELKLNEN